jgi:hypothetical protein
MITIGKITDLIFWRDSNRLEQKVTGLKHERTYTSISGYITVAAICNPVESKGADNRLAGS